MCTCSIPEKQLKNGVLLQTETNVISTLGNAKEVLINGYSFDSVAWNLVICQMCVHIGDRDMMTR